MSSAPRPKVSIGLPVYNGGNLIATALEAIQAQTFTDWELVICDNASEDDTQEICEKYAAEDPRIVYHRNPENVGAMGNFNLVWERSSGEYFKWQSHDDWVSPHFLEQCVRALDDDPGIVLAFGQMCRLDARDNTEVWVRSHEPIVDSASTLRRFHDSLWKLKFYPIFGVFRSSTFAETMGLTNNPEPDRILLAEVALRGRFAQIPHITLFQVSPRRESTWLWLNPGNTASRFGNSIRSVKGLLSAVKRFDGFSPPQRFLACLDLFVWSVWSRAKGKVRQVRRHYAIGWSNSPKVEPEEAERVVQELLAEEAAQY